MSAMLHPLELLFVVFYRSTASASGATQQYLEPVPIHTEDALFPTTGPVVAVISVAATIETDGRVSDVTTVDSAGSTDTGQRYPGTLNGYIEDSVAAARNWTFSPAIDLKGNTVRSLVSITFIYDRVFGSGTTLPKVESDLRKSGPYRPPFPYRVERAEYPLNSNAMGTVVLRERVDPSGLILGGQVVKSVPSLDKPCLDAAALWRFQPARIDGKLILSSSIAAFVFLPAIAPRD